MPFTSTHITQLARQLHTLLPRKTWSVATDEPAARDQLADACLAACEAAGLSEDAEEILKGVIISEALAGFVTGWGCRYGNLDEEVDRAQTALVEAIGGTIIDQGMYALAEGTPITVAAVANLIGWVTILEVDEQ